MKGTADTAGRLSIGILGPSSDRLAGLGQWFIAEHSALVRFATIVCGDRHVAEDLVHEAFVRVYLAGGDAEGSIAAYARRAIVNLSRSTFRRRAAERRALARLPRNEAAPPPEEHRDDMWDAIQQLSPRQRAVIALRFYEDMSERDIASTLGISPGNVKKHADRAITRLRALLEERRSG